MTEDAVASQSASPTQKVASLARDIHVSMLTTIDEFGHFTSRPMGQQSVEFDGTLWFFAEESSRKVAHIRRNPYANVTLTSRDTWISISGTARVVNDPERKKQLWNGWVEAWLPQGPDDPGVVLIALDGETAEYWDTPGGRVATAISFVKAKATGERFEGGENEVVDLR